MNVGKGKHLNPKVCSSENNPVIIPSQTNLALGSGSHCHQRPASASSTQINTDPMTVTNSTHGNGPERRAAHSFKERDNG